jgi:hypothetical protein
VIKGTKLDFYSVASPSLFAHRQITWLFISKKIQEYFQGQLTTMMEYAQLFKYFLKQKSSDIRKHLVVVFLLQ